MTAPDAVLAARLALRGREAEADIHQRLARAAFHLPEAMVAQLVLNDYTPEVGVQRMLATGQPGRAWQCRRRQRPLMTATAPYGDYARAPADEILGLRAAGALRISHFLHCAPGSVRKPWSTRWPNSTPPTGSASSA